VSGLLLLFENSVCDGICVSERGDCWADMTLGGTVGGDVVSMMSQYIYTVG
jgi:hypothetical protein